MFHPETGELWGVENSRDGLGNNIPPEEINIIVDGGNYGWPYCYSNKVYDTNFGGKNAAFCEQTLPPALPMQAHSAPLGLDFYLPRTMQFPADFRGDVFVAFHGSWDSSVPTGYKVVRVRVKDGRPESYEDFATGWLTGGSNRWGRPVDPVVGPDGSLYVTDDMTNAIYKITYKG
jgi:glucose/arabinose dehydrogenase